MEVRRGQGFPDHEVLIGSPSEQWKIVGNSVARPVALALGVSLRTASLANTAKEEASVPELNVALKNSVSGKVDDHKSEGLVVAAFGERTRNGWSAKQMLNKLTAALSPSRALVSAVSDTIGEPLTHGDHPLPTSPEPQRSRYIDSVKACQTGPEHSRPGTNGASGTSRLSPYRFEDDETSSALNTSTATAHSVLTGFASEGYGPISFQGFSAWAGQNTRRFNHEKTISMVSVTKTTTIGQEKFDTP